MPRLASSVVLVVFLYVIAAMQDSQVEPTYNNLADAFLHGRLSFAKEMSPEFMQDPYHFWKNERYILHEKVIDQSFYRGRVYSYFGPVPALLVYAPWRLVTGGRPLPDKMAVFLFATGAFFWAVSFFRKVCAKYFPDSSVFLRATVYGVLGLGNAAPFLIREAHMYEVAISSGIFFLTGGLYFLYSALSGDPRPGRRLAVAGLFLGLAIGCRPHLALAGAAAMAVGAWKLRETGAVRRLGTPFAVCVGVLLLYNLLRFDDAFEFGTKYQMTPINHKQASVLFDSSRVFANAHCFLFQPPEFIDRFPFVTQSMPLIPAWMHWPAGSFYTQKTVGLLTGVPFLLLFLMAPLAAWLSESANVRRFFRSDGLPARAALAAAGAYLSVVVFAELLRQLSVNAAITEAAAFFTRLHEEVPLALFFAAAFMALLLRRGFVRSGPEFPRLPFALALAPALVTLGTVLFFNMHTLRYLGDFTTPLILACGIVWLHFDRVVENEGVSGPALRVLGVSLGFCSMYFGVAYAFF